MSLAEQSMGLGLKALRAAAGMEVLDRAGLRGPAQKLVFQLSKNGFRAAGTAGRTFARVSGGGAAKRPPRAGGDPNLFDVTPTEEQAMFVEAMQGVAAGLLRPAALDADAACAAPPEVEEQAVELGLAGLGVPEELDGAAAERSAVTGVLVAEALAHGDAGLAVAMLAPGAVATALGLFGDADQQATYLPAFTGDGAPARAALALHEPEALFDPTRPATTARRDGGDLVLDGVKALVPLGVGAELLLVGVRLDDGRPGLVLVEGGTAGLSAEPMPAMGLRAAATARVVLDGVRVPAANLVGEGDPEVAAEVVHRARLGLCAVATGTAQAVLDYVIPYVNERKAFGEPVSHRQSVAFAVADLRIEVDGLRLVTYRAAGRADRGLEFGREAALARRLAATRAMQIGSQGVQLLGGHGYVKEHPVERWYRDLRATGVLEGALLV
jgi:alkylation response protein AidB-like acyl-CoA dehydrogenase